MVSKRVDASAHASYSSHPEDSTRAREREPGAGGRYSIAYCTIDVELASASFERQSLLQAPSVAIDLALVVQEVLKIWTNGRSLGI